MIILIIVILPRGKLYCYKAFKAAINFAFVMILFAIAYIPITRGHSIFFTSDTERVNIMNPKCFITLK